MFSFGPYLFRMTVFLAIVAAACGVLGQPIVRAFMSNPALNGLIVGVLVLGVLYTLRQVFMLRHEAAWIAAFRHRREGQWRERPGGGDELPQPRLLAPMATLLTAQEGSMRLSAVSMRSLLDSIASRLDESRALARYLIGLLIFLGLLGTFWGLLITINSVSDVISGLNMGAGNVNEVFANLKAGLASPLSGMGTAFSSSLFGLAGSLVLGFLDLQSGQAQNRFYNDLEEWLSGLTRLSGPSPLSGGEGSVPDYLEALLEKTADGLEGLQRTIARGEENRIAANAAQMQLYERLATLTDQMGVEQTLLARLTEGQIELRAVLTRLADSQGSGGAIDEATRTHIRNIEIYLARLLE
ncbi:MAG: flagellar motor protein MotA, partial [Alphaproteobacteria bacterium]